MREALIICPRHDNEGNTLEGLRAMAVAALVTAFGGCTVQEAFGHWADATGRVVSEPVWQLVTACVHSDDTADTLRSVAEMIGKLGRQWAVYVRLADGSVEIIDTAAAAGLKAAA